MWSCCPNQASRALTTVLILTLSLLSQPISKSPDDSLDTQAYLSITTTQTPSLQRIYDTMFTNTCLNGSMYKSLGHR